MLPRFITPHGLTVPEGMALVPSTHSHWLMVLSYLVASVAAWCALDIARHAAMTQDPLYRKVWQLVGGVCLGGGIWAMHFIAMLAYETPLTFHYHFGITVLSLLVAIGAAFLAMTAVAAPTLKASRYVLATVIVGLGISAMHYTGMAAVISIGEVYYSRDLVILSVVIAIAASLAAMLLFYYFRDKSASRHFPLKLLSAAVMGAAVVSMHVTGMSAYHLVAPIAALTGSVDADTHKGLAGATATMTLMILVTGMIASWAERARQNSEARMEELSSQINNIGLYDPLTGLLTRDALADLYGTLAEASDAREQQFALLQINLINFRQINDRYSYQTADRLLCVAAERIRSAARANDIVSRFAGDEFSVLARVNSVSEAQALAQLISDRMRRPMTLGDDSFQLPCSVGVTLTGSLTFSEAVRQSNIALQYAKQAQQNNVALFSPELEKDQLESQVIERELRKALDRRALEVHYQPIVDSRGVPRKLEALVRWRHPELGQVPPDRFIGLAENAGLITDLDLLVLERACEDFRYLKTDFPTLEHISVNCSPINLALPGLAATVTRIIRKAGADPRNVILEVTENALMANLGGAVTVLEEMRAEGISISIDDFGSGYSSLAYLSRLPIDNLKIDRLFVQDIPQRQENTLITAAIIAMARKLNLAVVAEGVETQEQLDFLRANQCGFIQGYYFSRPLPLPELEQWLAKQGQSLDKGRSGAVG